MPKTPTRGIQTGPTPPVPAVPFPGRAAPALEALAHSTEHNVIVIRDLAINLRDNLVRVCDGERLERARELVSRAVAVALGKD